MRIPRFSFAAALVVALALPASAAGNVFSELDEPATVETGPTISIATDKADYAPGELVTVTGSGWQPGENVAMSVIDDGVAEERFQYDALVTADENGDIVDRFNIAEWYVAEYYVTATGEYSGTATTSFTDTLADYRQGTVPASGTCTNPDNAVTSNDLRARCVRTLGATGQSVIVSGFGLDSVVPIGATNIQFNVEVEGLRGTANRAVRLALSHDGGTTFTTATNDTTAFTSGTTDQIKTFPQTQPTNCDNFGRTWTRSATPSLNELSDAKFQVRATTLGGTSETDFVDIDRIRVRVCYDGSNIVQAATGGRLTGVASPSAANVIGQVQVNLRGTGAPAWQGTTYQFEGGSESPCVNHTNHAGSAGGVTADHFFDMTAPAAHGTYDVTFRAYPTDSCTGTPLAPYTLTDAVTVGIFGDSFGHEADGVYDSNGWTDGGADCEVVRTDGIIDFDAFLRLRSSCTQTRSLISTAGLEKIHLKYRWGQDTTTTINNGLVVEWKKSSDAAWTNVNSHNLASATSTIPNSVDATLPAGAEDTNIDIRFTSNTGSDGQRALVDDVLVTGDPASNDATFTVTKAYSPAGPTGAVNVTLNCSDNDFDDTGSASPATPAVFNLSGFDAGMTCTATEDTEPAGYEASYSGCENVTIADGGTPTCDITNTTTTSITVDKDFSDDGSGEVTVTLTCESGDVTEDDNTATESDDAEFTVDGFTPGDTCDASEGAAPSGYSKDESDCEDLVLGTDTGCQIVNTTTATITVDKDFSDDGSGEVTVALTCDSGDVTEDDNTATESDDAEFTVDGFTPGDTCDASEGAAPSGYSKDESDCEDLVLGTDTGCQIVNTTTTTITVDKDFDDDNSSDEVTVTLTCDSGDVTDADNTATESDDAEFTVDGFTPGDTCDASEGSAPGGYSKDESDCEDLVLGTDTGCKIVNALNTTTITVDKDFDPNASGEVTVTLTCDSGDVTEDDNTATEADDAEFTVDGFTIGDECDASEGAAPAGYTKDESDCQDLVLGTDTSCKIVNTLNVTNVNVSKDFQPNNAASVTVALTCDGPGIVTTVAGDNTASEADDANFKVTGFNAGDTCDASETGVPPGYTPDTTDCQNISLATSPASCTIRNVQSQTLVTAGGCSFDRDTSRNLQQFPLIFTPDGSPTSKLSATNPGQFFMNAAYSGTSSTLTINIPYPFVTVGTNPTKVYDGVTSTTAGGKTCFTPDNQVASDTDQVTWNFGPTGTVNTFGQTKQITVNVPPTPGGPPNFAYARAHLAYGLKGVAGGCTGGAQSPPTATCTVPTNPLTISGYKTYPFSFGTTTPAFNVNGLIESSNVFKKNPGIGGLVTQTGTGTPVAGATVQIFQGTNATGTPLATVTTDADGWYMWSYKYTGKATSFTVKLLSTPAVPTQTVTLKSNGYLSVNFNNAP